MGFDLLLIERRQCPVAEVGPKRKTEKRWVVSGLPFLSIAEAWYLKPCDRVDPGTVNDHHAHHLGCFA